MIQIIILLTMLTALSSRQSSDKSSQPSEQDNRQVLSPPHPSSPFTDVMHKNMSQVPASVLSNDPWSLSRSDTVVRYEPQNPSNPAIFPAPKPGFATIRNLGFRCWKLIG